MPSRRILLVFLAVFGLVIVILGRLTPAQAAPAPQASTPSPWRVDIFADVTVRSGPGTEFDRVGVLIPGQTSDIIGRTPTGVWLKIVYLGGPDNAGWVLREFVRVIGDDPNMPTIIPPPTPTLLPTTTPDFGAVLSTDTAPTANPDAGRLPTFTPPAPEIQPTLLPAQGVVLNSGFPPAILITVLFVLGGFGGVLTIFRSRR